MLAATSVWCIAVVSATSNGSGPAGSYSLTVGQLAAAQTLVSGTAFEASTSPAGSGSFVIELGTWSAGQPIALNGFELQLDGVPAAGDSFSVKANSAETSSILDTIATLRAALQEPIASDTEAQLALRDSIALALTNLDKGIAAVDATRSSIGARLNTIDILTTENESLSITNASTQSSIRDTDMAEATAKLLLQQTMLEAAQLAFVRISQLTLFNQL